MWFLISPNVKSSTDKPNSKIRGQRKLKIAPSLYHTFHAPGPSGTGLPEELRFVCWLLLPQMLALNIITRPLPHLCYFLLIPSPQTLLWSSIRGSSLSFVLGRGRNIFKKSPYSFQRGVLVNHKMRRMYVPEGSDTQLVNLSSLTPNHRSLAILHELGLQK